MRRTIPLALLSLIISLYFTSEIALSDGRVEELFILASQAEKQIVETCSASRPYSDCNVPKFHFLEISNEMYSPNTRHIDVFMEVAAFNEANLRTLFAYLSRKNVGPPNITVGVYSNWEQLPLRMDCTDVIIPHAPKKREERNYHKAYYHLKNDPPIREYFVYTTEVGPGGRKFRTVGIQGTKSYDGGHVW